MIDKNRFELRINQILSTIDCLLDKTIDFNFGIQLIAAISKEIQLDKESIFLRFNQIAQELERTPPGRKIKTYSKEKMMILIDDENYMKRTQEEVFLLCESIKSIFTK